MDVVTAFGERVSVEEAERALCEACRRGHAEVVEFTVVVSDAHEWLIEFAEPPRAPETFVRVLDEALQKLNTDYRTKRAGDVGMAAPRVLELPAGTFYRWWRERPSEYDVPRVAGDRIVADSILAVVAAHNREPLIAVGS